MSSTQKRLQVVESTLARTLVMSDRLSGAFETAVSITGEDALTAVDEDTDVVIPPECLVNTRAAVRVSYNGSHTL